jgi:2-polyprenyl-3-methyl-5-hydroxy-6-metoxy-1,4-benzoquinol methylase
VGVVVANDSGDMTSLSEWNRETFDERVFDPRESRLRKAFAMLVAEPRGRVLDVAAGSGIAAQALSSDGWTVSALEISEALAEQVRGRGVDDVQVHDLASGRLPYEEGSFRAVFAGEIIEHLVDTTGFLGEVRRVLAPGGVVVITTPNLASFENRVRMLFGRYPNFVEYELGGDGHVRAYTLPVLRRQLEASGFAVEDERGNWVPFLPQVLMNDVRTPFVARTGDWFPRLSQGLIVKARRPG